MTLAHPERVLGSRLKHRLVPWGSAMIEDIEEPQAGTGTADRQPSPTPYVHEADAAEAVAQAIDHAFEVAARWFDVDTEFRNAAVAAGFDPEAPVVREASYALLYLLRVEYGGGSAGCALRPVTDTEDFAFPPRPSDVAEPVAKLWSAIAAAAKHAGARARFSDLLFERQRGRGSARTHALRAADAYIEGAIACASFDATQALTRAWELVRSVGDAAREDHVRELMVLMATAGLGDQPAPPGIILPLINALTTPPRSITGRKARKNLEQAPPKAAPPDLRVDELIERAFVSYPDGHLASEVAEYMRCRNSDDASREKINRREIQARIDEASKRPGLVRMRILEEAVALANRYNQKDLAEHATALMQAIPQSELGLVSMGADMEVNTDYIVHIERWLRPFTLYPDWREGLIYFLHTGCPTGNLPTIDSQSRAIAAMTAFRSLIPTTRLNADGLPHWTASTDEQRRAEQMAEYAHIQAAQSGRHLAQGLMRMKERYGTPEETDLLVLLSAGGKVDQALASSLARAFRHFWNDDFEACVHVAVPKVEAAARALLRAADEGIYRTQAANTPGGYPGLYVLIDKLRGLGLDESWAYFLQWLLSAPSGVNLRNEVAHGFIGDTGPGYAALALRAATFLSTMVAPIPASTVRTRERGRVEVRHAPDPTPPRSREDLLRLLADPIAEPVPLPARPGLVGRVARLGASVTRVAAVALAAVSDRLDR